VETIENKPDTTLTMLSGKKLVVKETPDILLKKIIDYRHRLGCLGNES